MKQPATQEVRHALNLILQSKENAWVYGHFGSGKSSLLREVERQLEGSLFLDLSQDKFRLSSIAQYKTVILDEFTQLYRGPGPMKAPLEELTALPTTRLIISSQLPLPQELKMDSFFPLQIGLKGSEWGSFLNFQINELGLPEVTEEEATELELLQKVLTSLRRFSQRGHLVNADLRGMSQAFLRRRKEHKYFDGYFEILHQAIDPGFELDQFDLASEEERRITKLLILLRYLPDIALTAKGIADLLNLKEEEISSSLQALVEKDVAHLEKGGYSLNRHSARMLHLMGTQS